MTRLQTSIVLAVIASVVSLIVWFAYWLATKPPSYDTYKIDSVSFIEEKADENAKRYDYRLGVFKDDDGNVYHFYVYEDTFPAISTENKYNITYRMNMNIFPNDYRLTEIIPVKSTKVKEE